VNVHKDYRKNLDSHTLPCIFIGFAPGYKGWLCYDPVGRKQVISQDVIFNGRSFPGLSTKGKEVVVPLAKFSDLWFNKDDQGTEKETSEQLVMDRGCPRVGSQPPVPDPRQTLTRRQGYGFWRVSGGSGAGTGNPWG
jgi:hypothetical protein